VGAFLSGGLDSTSVACIAREIRREQAGEGDPEEVPVFSAVFDEVKESDEKPFIEAALEGGGLEPHWIVGENRSPLMELEKLLWHLDEPVIGTNLGSSWTHFRPAREIDLRVILDGHGGDETVGFGESRLSELFQKRQWRALWLELRAMERNGLLEGGAGAAQLMRRLLARAFGPARLWLRLRNGIARRLPDNGQGKNGASSAAAEVGAAKGTGPGEAGVPWQERLSPEFAHRIGARAMYEKWKPSEPRLTQGERAFNEATLSAPLQALAFEELDHAAAAWQIEARYPMWDKRLVELCLGLPSHHKLRDGWTRSILRRSLDGVLPPLVQWRAGKNDFTHEAWRGLRVHNADWLKKMIDKQLSFVSSYTDADKAADAARQILEAQVPTAGLSQTVVRTASLEAWLAMQTIQRQQEPRREPKQDLQDEREDQERQEEPSLLAHV
jgi:asparagine synthase (glutamine-hydrolysing)